MRSAWIALGIAVACAAPACEKRKRRPPPTIGPASATTSAPRPGERPEWLPKYSPAQRAVLESSRGMQVALPTLEVYPDLVRFAYAKPQAFDATRARAAAATVSKTVRESQRLYVIGPGDPKLANLVAQYGPPPPPEPDRWVRAVRNGDGRYRLEWATPSSSARSFVDRGNRALASGQLNDAAKSFETAANQSKTAPALWVALAEVHASMGNDSGAEHALGKALSVDPRHPDAHRVMAEVLARRGDLDSARGAIARALALHPNWPRAWATAERIARVQSRPAPARLFLEVGAGGAIHVGVSATPEGRAYGACRAVARYEPELRMKMLGFAKDAPYHLSLGEELFCMEAALGTRLAPAAPPPDPTPPAAAPPAPTPTPPPSTADGGAAPPAPPSGGPAAGQPSMLFQADTAPQGGGSPTTSAPPTAPPTAPPPAAAPPLTPPPAPPAPPAARDPIDELLQIANAGLLAEYAMFEVIGQHRPEWLRVAPDDLHESIVRYVEDRVLAPR